jgi:hypothetical protein
VQTGTKREEILYRFFVAPCKANPAVCLHGAEIGGIDLPNSKTYKLKNSRFAYFLKNPNRSWLRSFRSPWGVGGKKRNRREKFAILTKLQYLYGEF